jgi:SAM-dependent methyltransferase
MNSKYLENYKNVIRGDPNIPSSLLAFCLDSIEKFKPKSVIELGSDQGQLLSKLPVDIKNGFEISPQAVEISNKLHPSFLSICHDVLNPWNLKADLIIDSHLFHCFLSKEERLIYLQNIKQSLNVGGRVLIECMGKPHELNSRHILINEASQIWAETNQLKYLGSLTMNHRNFLPFRSFFNHDTEKEISEVGLTIYSLVYTNLEFEFSIMDEIIRAPVVRVVLG